MKKFKIQSDFGRDTEGEPEYWANDFGWTDFYNGTEFNEDELTKINLPLDAMYIRWTDPNGEYTWCKANLERVEKVIERLKL